MFGIFHKKKCEMADKNIKCYINLQFRVDFKVVRIIGLQIELYKKLPFKKFNPAYSNILLQFYDFFLKAPLRNPYPLRVCMRRRISEFVLAILKVVLLLPQNRK